MNFFYLEKFPVKTRFIMSYFYYRMRRRQLKVRAATRMTVACPFPPVKVTKGHPPI